MGLIDRVKNILVTPKTEWGVIAGETTPAATLITGYVLPLAAIAAIATFIGTVLVGTSLGILGTYRTPLVWGLVILVLQVAMAVVTVFVVGFIIDALAASFGAQKNSAQALKLAVYSCTPAWIAGVLNIIPLLGMLAILAAIYGIYLLYLGLPVLMKNPPDKTAGYTVVVVVATIVVMVIINVMIGLVTAPALMGAAALSGSSSHSSFSKDSPMGKLEDFGRKMEAAGKKMEAAQKSGDPAKQADAAMAALGTAISGGKRAEPLSMEEVKAFIPETFAGLPKTSSKAGRSGTASFLVAKAEATYRDPAGGKSVRLEVTDTGGAAGMMGLAAWAGALNTDKEDDNGTQRTRKEGDRVVHERTSKRGGGNEFSLILANRFLVKAVGNGVDLATLKSAMGAVDLAKLESLKDKGVAGN